MDKAGKLKSILKRIESAVMAFSGGVDSSFLLKIAKETLPKKSLLAVTAVSETYTRTELKQAKRFAKDLEVEHKIIRTNELKDKNFTKNPVNRCYYCKYELFKKLDKIKQDYGFRHVLDASNIDDIKDYRPGSKAKKKFGVRSPLIEASFSKSDIRKFSRRLNINTANMPSMACLASRFPYGQSINKEALRRVETAEDYIKEHGISQVRVRCHGDIARIEVEKRDIKMFLDKRFCDVVVRKLKHFGFKYVTLDLEGYRSGSLNEVLPLATMRK